MGLCFVDFVPLVFVELYTELGLSLIRLHGWSLASFFAIERIVVLKCGRLYNTNKDYCLLTYHTWLTYLHFTPTAAILTAFHRTTMLSPTPAWSPDSDPEPKLTQTTDLTWSSEYSLLIFLHIALKNYENLSSSTVFFVTHRLHSMKTMTEDNNDKDDNEVTEDNASVRTGDNNIQIRRHSNFSENIPISCLAIYSFISPFDLLTFKTLRTRVHQN